MWLLVTNIDNLWLPVTNIDNLWLPVTIIDNLWLSVTNIDNLWLSVTIIDNLWLSVTNVDYMWLMSTSIYDSVLPCYVRTNDMIPLLVSREYATTVCVFNVIYTNVNIVYYSSSSLTIQSAYIHLYLYIPACA